MKVYSFSCEGCNNSCPLEVTTDNGEILKIEGNCCHRGLVSGEKLARRKIEIDAGYADGEYEFVCPGCYINCEMIVSVENKQVISVRGDGCPRGQSKAKQKFERRS